MKKYKLKKDLPTFKAGMVAELNDDGDLVLVGTRETSAPFIKGYYVVYPRQELDVFPNILKDWFEEIPEQPKTVWDLGNGDTYYSISSGGFITTEKYSFDTQFEDNQRIAIGNVFLTKEDAEKELTRRKAKQILLRDTKGFKPKFGAICSIEDFGYEVQYERDVDGLYVISYKHNDGTIRFATEEDARASIKAHEKEWKIYLGMEE